MSRFVMFWCASSSHRRRRRLSGGAYLALACFFAWADPTFAQDSNAQLKAEVEELRATVMELQQEVGVLKAQNSQHPVVSVVQPTRPQTSSAPPTAPLVPMRPIEPGVPAPLVVADVAHPTLWRRQSVSDNSAAASRIDNQAPPTNPDLKGFFQIPGTDTMIRVGGYAKLDAIYDTGSAGNNDKFVTSSITVPQDHDVGGNFNMQARQTRFSFEVRRPSDIGGTMRFYVENDFFSGDNNQYTFHLRQAFGQLGNTYAGYGYSALMDADALPDTLDFGGPNSKLFLLQPSVHQAFHLGKTSSLTLSLERPSSEVSSINSGTTVKGTQQFPDVVLALRTEHPWGHVQAGFVGRRLGYTDGGHQGRAYGEGVALTSVLNVSGNHEGRDLLAFSGTWGKGIAHFISDTSALGLDAAVNGKGKLNALDVWGTYAAYTHYWNADWRSNLVYGVVREQHSSLLAKTAFRGSTYSATNLIWSPVSTLTVGMELLYGSHEQQGGASSNDMRIQTSLKYSFVR